MRCRWLLSKCCLSISEAEDPGSYWISDAVDVLDVNSCLLQRSLLGDKRVLTPTLCWPCCRADSLCACWKRSSDVSCDQDGLPRNIPLKFFISVHMESNCTLENIYFQSSLCSHAFLLCQHSGCSSMVHGLSHETLGMPLSSILHNFL